MYLTSHVWNNILWTDVAGVSFADSITSDESSGNLRWLRAFKVHMKNNTFVKGIKALVRTVFKDDLKLEVKMNLGMGLQMD